MEEHWRDVPGYEGFYQVSSLGRVKSLARLSLQNHALPERIRRAVRDKDGYRVVNLCRDGQARLHKVHRPVGAAFLGPPGEGAQINHLDGDKANNRAENLEWCSASENIRHAFRTGLKTGRRVSSYGETNSHCRLTDAACAEMRRVKRESGCSNAALARRYGVSPSQVGRVINNRQRTKGSVRVD